MTKKYLVPDIKLPSLRAEDILKEVDIDISDVSGSLQGEVMRKGRYGSDFSIDKLIANMTQPAMSNQFEVDFLGPSIYRNIEPTETNSFSIAGEIGQTITQSNYKSTNVNLSLEGVRCRSASLPARTIETELYSPVGKGKPTPTGVVSDSHSMDISFYCDTDFIDRKILQAWMDYIVSTDTAPLVNSGSGDGTSDSVDVERSHLPLFQYPKSYFGQVIIRHLRRDKARDGSKGTVETTLHNAFPSAIATQELSMDSSDMLLFTVTISFEHFITKYYEEERVADLSDLHLVYNGKNKVYPKGLNSGRRFFDGIQDALGLAARFGDDGAEKYLKKFNKYDTQISRLKNSLRDFSSLFGG